MISEVRTECHWAIALLNIGSLLTWAGLVERHTPGAENFNFNLQQKIKGHIDFHGKQSHYFLEDKFEFLDSTTEWV